MCIVGSCDTLSTYLFLKLYFGFKQSTTLLWNVKFSSEIIKFPIKSLLLKVLQMKARESNAITMETLIQPSKKNTKTSGSNVDDACADYIIHPTEGENVDLLGKILVFASPYFCWGSSFSYLYTFYFETIPVPLGVRGLSFPLAALS